MSIERYFTKLPKDAPLPISWKPPAPKRPKRGQGRLRKKCPPVTVMIDGSDEENDADDNQGTENSVESCENDELENRENGRHEAFIQHQTEMCSCFLH